jgi:hypothetical protein
LLEPSERSSDMKMFIAKEALTDLTEFIQNQKQAERELFLLKSQMKARADDTTMLKQRIERAFTIADGYVTPMNATVLESAFYQRKREEALKDVGEMERIITENDRLLEQLPEQIKAKELEVSLGRKFLEGFMVVEVEAVKM